MASSRGGTRGWRVGAERGCMWEVWGGVGMQALLGGGGGRAGLAVGCRMPKRVGFEATEVKSPEDHRVSRLCSVV